MPAQPSTNEQGDSVSEMPKRFTTGGLSQIQKAVQYRPNITNITEEENEEEDTADKI